jgi:hypothetical protein
MRIALDVQRADAQILTGETVDDIAAVGADDRNIEAGEAFVDS